MSKEKIIVIFVVIGIMIAGVFVSNITTCVKSDKEIKTESFVNNNSKDSSISDAFPFFGKNENITPEEKEKRKCFYIFHIFVVFALFISAYYGIVRNDASVATIVVIGELIVFFLYK